MPTTTLYPGCQCCGGPPGVTTACCPSPVPTTLHATLTASGSDADCSSMAGTHVLTYNAGANAWQTPTFTLAHEGVNTYRFKLTCTGTTWVFALLVDFAGGPNPSNPCGSATGSGTCSPFSFSFSFNTTCLIGGCSLGITVTP